MTERRFEGGMNRQMTPAMTRGAEPAGEATSAQERTDTALPRRDEATRDSGEGDGA